MQRTDAHITEIQVSRKFLQNPHKYDPTVAALSNEACLTWIDTTMEEIRTKNIHPYLIVVDDDGILAESETIMLEAIRNYFIEHFKNLNASENAKTTNSSSPSETATAAATAAATASTDAVSSAPAATAPASEQPPAAITTPLQQAIDMASTATAAAAAAAATTAAGTSDSVAASPTTLETAPPIPPAAPEETIDPALAAVKKILNLDIWQQKGRGLFGSFIPNGITEMKKINNATLCDLAAIALCKSSPSSFESMRRGNMTSRFYTAISALDKIPTLTGQLDYLSDYAKKELISDYKIREKWGFSKVLLSDNDVSTLCEIAKIQPTDIKVLAVAAATAAAAATTATIADEAPQTGLHL